MALACGVPHPDFILPYMTLEQISDVAAYDKIEPIGGFREDYRFAQVCLLLHNQIQQQRGDGKWRTANLQDFMLWGPKGKSESGDKPQSVEEQKAIMLSLASPKKEKK